MTWNPYPPLPVEALRDLLGITRALYRSLLAADATDARLRPLEDIGKTLRVALGAAGAHPGTTAHGEAWVLAERATRELGELVARTPIASLVEATAVRVARPSSMGASGMPRSGLRQA